MNAYLRGCLFVSIVPMLASCAARRPEPASDTRFVLQRAHASPVLSAAFSSDGTLVATGAAMEVKLWEVSTGALLRTWRKPSYPRRFVAVAFCKGDRRVVAVDGEGEVLSWDTDTGALVQEARAGARPLRASFGDDGEELLLSGDDGALVVWPSAGATLRLGAIEPVDASALASNGSLAVVARRSEVAVYGAADGKKRVAFALPPDAVARALTFRGDVVIVALDRPTKRSVDTIAFDATTGAPVPAEKPTTVFSIGDPSVNGTVIALRTTANGTLAAALGAPFSLRPNAVANHIDARTWDADKPGHVAALARDASLALVAGTDGVCLRHPSGTTARCLGTTLATAGRELAVSADGRWGALFDPPTVWDLESARLVRRPNGAAWPLVFAKGDREVVARVRRERPLRTASGALAAYGAWDVATGAAQLFAGPSPVTLARSPDGTMLFLGTVTEGAATDGQRGAVPSLRFGCAVVDARTGSLVREIAMPEGTYAFRSPTVLGDGRLVYPFMNEAILVAPETGTSEVVESSLWSRVLSDGTRVAMAARQDVTVSNVVDGTVSRTFEGRGRVLAAADDGEVLTVTFDGAGMLWSTRTGAVKSRYPSLEIDDAKLVLGGHYFLAVDDDDVRLYRGADGRYVTFVASATEWISVDEAGKFQGSARGGDLVALVRGRHAQRLSEIRSTNERPDLVTGWTGLGR